MTGPQDVGPSGPEPSGSAPPVRPNEALLIPALVPSTAVTWNPPVGNIVPPQAMYTRQRLPLHVPPAGPVTTNVVLLPPGTDTLKSATQSP